MRATPPEVHVLGAGPAGAAAARLLAQWGHDVVLTDKSAPAAHTLPESIPPSTRKLFDVLGVADAVDRAGFVRQTGNTVWWGSADARIEEFAGADRGWQVTAGQLGDLLRSAAADAGARLESARATPDDLTTSGAKYVLDCTGRAGVIARARRLRVAEPGHRTVALIGRWHVGRAFDTPDPTHTVIESYDDGWAWSVPLSGGERAVAVMVDPHRSNLAKDRAAREVFEAEIGKTSQFCRLLADAVLIDGPAGFDASMYHAREYVTGNCLLVGDAGSFIDPLSSAGVKKAMASGWLAAVAVHTSLARPEMRDTALAFFAVREAEVYAAFRSLTRRHLTAAAAGHAHPFWTDRADPSPSEDEGSSAVTGAFERIRLADTLRVARAVDLRVERMPTVKGSEIVLESRIVTPLDPAGVGHVCGVDMLALVELAPAFRHVPELFAAYNTGNEPVGLPQFLLALATAVARGWLVEKSG